MFAKATTQQRTLFKVLQSTRALALVRGNPSFANTADHKAFAITLIAGYAGKY